MEILWYEHSEGILTIFLTGDIDAQNLAYISSAGLRVMLLIQKEWNAPISIINLSAEVLDIFQMAGFQHLLEIKGV